jgi:hypothetical protein
MDVARRLQALAERLVEAEEQGADLDALLGQVLKVGVEADRYLPAAVRDARRRGRSWSSIARAADVSTATARTLWDEAARPPAPRSAPPSAGAERPRDATTLLTSAMSFLVSTSGLSDGAVARRAGAPELVLRRMLDAEAVPDWGMTQTVVVAAGGRPEDVRVLWEWTQASHPPPLRPRSLGEALTRFHGAVRGLYLAARCPLLGSEDRLLAAVLDGDLVPDWRGVKGLVEQLGGESTRMRPLWEDVRRFLVLASSLMQPRE